MKVLHVSQPSTHGTAHCVLALAKHQAATGHEPVVAAPASALLDSVARANITSRTWDAGRSFGSNTISEARALAAIISEQQPDVIHLHSSKASLVGRLVIRGKYPTIVHPHAWSFYALSATMAPVGRSIEHWLSRWADLVLCTGSAELRDGVEAGVLTALQNVGNGVDTDTLRPATAATRKAARVRLGIDLNARVAVTVGRLCEQKAQLEFVEEWEASKLDPLDLLVLVGDGPTRAAVQSAAGKQVLLLGERDDVADILAASDVYVQPSRWEGLSIGLLEAMALDLPVVTTDAGSTADAVGCLGVMHPVGDYPALMRSTVDALGGNVPSKGVMRRRVEERFSMSGWAERVTDLALSTAGFVPTQPQEVKC